LKQKPNQHMIENVSIGQRYQNENKIPIEKEMLINKWYSPLPKRDVNWDKNSQKERVGSNT